MAASNVQTLSAWIGRAVALRDAGIGHEPERVAMERVLLVLGRGDDQEALPGRDVFQRRELAANALAVAGIEGEEAGERKLGVRGRGHGDVGHEGPDQVVGLAQADDQLAADLSVGTGRKLADGQALDLALVDGLGAQALVLERLDQGRRQPP